MRPIRLVSLAILGLALLVLPGCFVIRSQTVTQPDVIGDVQISTTVCIQDGNPSNPCVGSKQTGPPHPTNLLIAYRVPDGVDGPETFIRAHGYPLTFKKDQTYVDALNINAAPPPGEHWIGYRADTAPVTDDPTMEPRFSLPQAADGAPFHGPFKYRTVVGWIDDQSPDRTDPVDCTHTSSNGSSSVCIDFPDDSTWPTDEEITTRDLGITGGDPTSVMQAASAQMPFTAQFAGTADPAASFEISVESNAPDGVTLTPSTTTFTPDSDSSTPLTVNAQVAPTVPAGDYDVTLVAKLPNGLDRRRTGKLSVVVGKPVNLLLPDITGTAAVGKSVTCENGSWSSSPSKFSYAWKRDGTAIAGATSRKYKLVQDDGARLVTCTVTAANDIGTGAAMSGPIRAAQEGGADVDLDGKPKATLNSDGTYTIDTGITVSCPARLRANCAGSSHIDAKTSTRGGNAARVLEVARGGFAAKPGGKRKIVLHLTKRRSRLFKNRKKLRLIASVITRNHQLQRVVSKKRFTVSVPH